MVYIHLFNTNKFYSPKPPKMKLLHRTALTELNLKAENLPDALAGRVADLEQRISESLSAEITPQEQKEFESESGVLAHEIKNWDERERNDEPPASTTSQIKKDEPQQQQAPASDSQQNNQEPEEPLKKRFVGGIGRKHLSGEGEE